MDTRSLSCFWNLEQTVALSAVELSGGKREAKKGEEDEDTSS